MTFSIACVDLRIQSDSYEDLKWFLLVKPLTCDLPPDLSAECTSSSSGAYVQYIREVLHEVVVDLKSVLADAASGVPSLDASA